ncbi:hypothetical protein OCUBac02_04170 [Bosea sp. ANAM02]|nr:hypothetical protein OCUBac02_04170 [Bosea sp. ANAM02]
MRDHLQERAPSRHAIPYLRSGIHMPQRARDDTLTAPAQTWRATIIFLTSAIALAGFKPFGQAFAQFMMVWQR